MPRRRRFKSDTARATARWRQAEGFALVELLVVIGIIVVLLALGIAVISRARSSTYAVQCVNQLKQIGIAFQSYCVENSGRFPDPLAVQSSWESMVRKYLPSLKILRCPADREVFPSLGSSYDWRDGGNTAASVAGKSIHACRSDAVLAFDALPGWHRQRMMNVVRIDGAALGMPEQQCLADLRRSVIAEPGGN